MGEEHGENTADLEERSFLKEKVNGREDAVTKEADDFSPKVRTRCQRFLAWQGALLTLTIVGAGLGFALGFALYVTNASSDVIVWVGLPGELYMRMLKASVLPLIVSSIIAGTAGLKPKDSGRVSGVALTYIIITNIMGAVVGTVLAVIIRPGAGQGADNTESKILDTGNLQTGDLFADLIRNLAPDNLVTACFQKSQTRYRETVTANTTQYARYLDTAGGTNVLGLVVVSAALGIAAAQQGEIARPFLNFFSAAAEIVMRLITWMIWLTPLGVASLIAKTIGGSSDLVTVFRGLGFLVLAQVIGNVVIAIGLVCVIYLVFQRKNPFVFLVGVSRAFITALAASSSAVAMPEIVTCVESRHQVDPRVSRFVVPLAAALNRDGSAMFIASTSVYMAQLHGSVDAGTVILIAILTSVGSLATPAVHSSSVVTIMMILASLEIDSANLGIIIALEWFSDRMRSSVNAISHALCAIVTWQFCRASLDPGDGQILSAEIKTSQMSLHILPDKTADLDDRDHKDYI